MNLTVNKSVSAKPFLKWAGGKGQLIQTISCCLPEDIESTGKLTFIEPFVGSGAVMFWFLNRYKNVTKAVINDINTDLTTAYKVIKEEPEELIKKLEKIQTQYFSLSSEDAKKDFFLEKREKFNARTKNRIDATALLIFLNKTCFNGLYRVNSKNQFNVPFGRYVKPAICDAKNILAVSALLQRVIILNGDYSRTLDYADNNSFFYFDPPYKPLSKTASFNSYSHKCFDDSEQERLLAFCKKLDELGISWLLSNSDLKNTNSCNEYFDTLYKEFTIRRVKARRYINSDSSKRGDISELLVCNYKV